jgi:hypothetical protein
MNRIVVAIPGANAFRSECLILIANEVNYQCANGTSALSGDPENDRKSHLNSRLMCISIGHFHHFAAGSRRSCLDASGFPDCQWLVSICIPSSAEATCNDGSLTLGIAHESQWNPVLGLAVSRALRLLNAHHFHRVAFLPLCNSLALEVSPDVSLCGRSHSNLSLNSPLSSVCAPALVQAFVTDL